MMDQSRVRFTKDYVYFDEEGQSQVVPKGTKGHVIGAVGIEGNVGRWGKVVTDPPRSSVHGDYILVLQTGVTELDDGQD